MDICSADGCLLARVKRGFCEKHYRRFMRHGDPLTVVSRQHVRRPFIEAAVRSSTDKCIIWPFAKSDGYGFINEDDGTTTNSHRMVCRLAHGEPPTSEHQAAHSCGNRSCCNPRHIRWATREENHADKKLHGTQPCGERMHNAKFKTADILEMRRRRSAGESLKSIAASFGAHRSHVSRVARGELWAHITDTSKRIAS
jgi:hypothetical protein